MKDGKPTDERTAYVCRNDTTSIKRHKDRWHVGKDHEKCTIVPSDSAEVHKIRSKHSKSSATVPPVSRGKTNKESERSTEEVPTSRTTSSTLIKYTPDETKTSEDARVDATLNDIMDAIKSLGVKVGELGKHHHSITQLAFEDKSLRNDVSKMWKAENIHEMAHSSELLEFFYDENAGTSVLRCRACFDYHCITSSHCKSMTPLQAQQKLNLHGNSTLRTGLFQSQAVTKLLIEGHNQTWYTKKNMCINHFVLLGEGI